MVRPISADNFGMCCVNHVAEIFWLLPTESEQIIATMLACPHQQPAATPSTPSTLTATSINL
jgi:hypothetical protein